METTAAARMPQCWRNTTNVICRVQLALETGTTRRLIDAVLNYRSWNPADRRAAGTPGTGRTNRV